MQIKSPEYKLPSLVRDVDFIYEMPKSLDKDFCKNTINRFEEDDRKYEGCIGDGIVKPEIKSTYDLTLSDKEDYQKEDDVFFHALKKGMLSYFEYCKTISDGLVELGGLASKYELNDTGYQIQRYEPGGHYSWHHDYMCDEVYGSRQITYIWYLNTIKDGTGYTEFACGKKVYPKAGKLVVFPSSWQYVHRGYPSKDKRKYICTGWVYATTRNQL
tara:strand:- start:1435 stop:2079 length:645 start_codon:yes stop_codon:yes gene_type:complete